MSETHKRNLRIVEAFIFASSIPVSENMLKRILPVGIEPGSLLEQLRKDYSARGVNLVKAGKSWSFHTASDISSILNKEVKKVRKPSRAAIEVLAIIAYHQPITRAEIEEIRGVSLSKGTLDFLFELDWIKPNGRRPSPGRPVIWVTTDDFLNHFGLTKIKDLPGLDELKAAGLLEVGPSISLFSNTIDPEQAAKVADKEETEDSLLANNLIESDEDQFGVKEVLQDK